MRDQGTRAEHDHGEHVGVPVGSACRASHAELLAAAHKYSTEAGSRGLADDPFRIMHTDPVAKDDTEQRMALLELKR